MRPGPRVVVAAIALALFIPALDGRFVYDDHELFEGQTGYQGFSFENLRWMFGQATIHYIPLTWLTHAWDYTFWGLYPWGHHLTSVLLHAINAALAYGVLLRLLEGRVREPRWGAFAGALFFAIHPLRVESVAWVTDRRDVLSGFFVLLTLGAYLGGRRKTALLCYVLSLLAKSQSLALPLVLLVLDAYPLRRFGRAAIVEKLPWLAAMAASATLTAVMSTELWAPWTAAEYTLADRLLQPGVRLCFYLEKTIWPLDLGPLYEFRGETPLWPTLPALAITVAAVALRRRAPWLAAAWFSFVLLLGPVIGLVQAGPQFAADRYTYVACLPWAVLAGALCGRMGPNLPAAAVLGSLALLTWNQIPAWHDEVALWTRAVRVDPGPFACHNLGSAHFGMGRYREAVACYDRAIAMRSDYSLALTDRGLAKRQLEDFEGAEEDYTRAIQLKGWPDAYFLRGELRRKVGDTAGAAADFRAALERAPPAWPRRRQAERALERP